MLAALKRLTLVVVMAVLPLQGLAAVVIPVCQYDDTSGSSLAGFDHRHADEHDHDHGATIADLDHPIAASDSGSDHCSTGSAFAIPVMSTKPAPAATTERSWFAAAYRSGFIPEQPQRPPRA